MSQPPSGPPAPKPSVLFHQTEVRSMQDYPVLRVSCASLIPLILLYALYVQFHGDFGPGGGFQAGVIFASGLVLHGIIYGLPALERVAPRSVLEVGLALGVLLYAGTGVASLFLGGNYLDYAVLDSHDPIHGRHLGILLVEGGVGIAVTCAMTLIFMAFGGRREARHEEGLVVPRHPARPNGREGHA